MKARPVLQPGEVAGDVQPRPEACERGDGDAVAVRLRSPVRIEAAARVDMRESLAEYAVHVDEAATDVPAAAAVGNRRADRVIDAEGG